MNIGAANDMDTFGKRILPQVIQQIQLSAYRARKLQTNRRRRPTKRRSNFDLRSTACMQAVDLNALLKAELAITLSHRHNTLVARFIQIAG